VTNTDTILSARPSLRDAYSSFCQTFWEDGHISPSILHLCRLHIASIHGCKDEWELRDERTPMDDQTLSALVSGDFDHFEPEAKTALLLAAKIPFDHHGISDQEVADAKKVFGEPGTVSLLTALAFFDVNCRLQMVLTRKATTHSDV
jgi:alkylhydroperoxidase family enzyme